jgi:uncharacterized protein (TIGR02757 family)
MKRAELKSFLDEKYAQYCTEAFLEFDPIQLPHRFTKKSDIEIAGLFAALFAWGQRKTIIHKGNELLARMDNSPADFVCHATAADLKHLDGFVHRTFNELDIKSLVLALQDVLKDRESLEDLFLVNDDRKNLKNGLANFRNQLIAVGLPKRTWRHLPDPFNKSAAKRLNMYLRWMVRTGSPGIDLGIWTAISPAVLSCPLDVHSGRVARSLRMLKRPQNDWQAVEELDENLRMLDPSDPVKYDFALFGLGVFEHFS